MDWKLEVVVVPVSDVDRAKAFYADRAGFVVDHDTDTGAMRAVQLTPPGSGCSIVIGRGLAEMAPGLRLKGLQLVVPDIRSAREELAERGVDISEVRVFDRTGFRPARPDDPLDDVGFAFFDDPDGNGWAVQQIRRG